MRWRRHEWKPNRPASTSEVSKTRSPRTTSPKTLRPNILGLPGPIQRDVASRFAPPASSGIRCVQETANNVDVLFLLLDEGHVTTLLEDVQS